MKRAVAILFFLFHSIGFAQNDTHKKAVDTFIMDFNKGDFEHIYQSYAPEMKKARTKKQTFDFLMRVKQNAGALLLLDLYNYRENSRKIARGNYNGKFVNELMSVQITTNGRGEITGLFIKKNTNL